jgi:hypothetical protein
MFNKEFAGSKFTGSRFCSRFQVAGSKNNSGDIDTGKPARLFSAATI